MTAWTSDELNKIGKAEELEIVSLRSDGTLRSPVTIWVVRVDEDLYVRAVKGRAGPWFRGVLTCHMGRISSGGVEKDVTFVEEAGTAICELIDSAYREKYHRYTKEYVDACVTSEARDATLKLVPRL